MSNGLISLAQKVVNTTWPFLSSKQGGRDVVTKSNDIVDYYPIRASGLLGVSLQSSRINSAQAFSLYQNSSAVATAVEAIASKVQDITPVVMTRDGDIQSGSDVERLLNFLDHPNEDQTWQMFIGDACRYWLLTNNFYLTKVNSSSERGVELLGAVHPVNISSVQSTFNGVADRYDIVLDRGRTNNLLASHTFSREIVRSGPDRRRRAVYKADRNLAELLPFHGFSTRPQAVEGDSPLEPVLLDIRQQILGRNYNASMLQNGARPSATLLLKGTPTQDQVDEAHERINKDYAGSQNAGSVLVFGSDDAEWVNLAVTNKDMDFAILDSRAASAVFSKYKVPLPLITSDRQTFSNYETAVEAFYDDAVLPVTRILFGALSKFLFENFQLDSSTLKLGVDIHQIDALRRRHIVDLQARADLGVETINEIREFLPMREALPEGDALMGAAPAPVDEDPQDGQDDEDLEIEEGSDA